MHFLLVVYSDSIRLRTGQNFIISFTAPFSVADSSRFRFSKKLYQRHPIEMILLPSTRARTLIFLTFFIEFVPMKRVVFTGCVGRYIFFLIFISMYQWGIQNTSNLIVFEWYTSNLSETCIKGSLWNRKHFLWNSLRKLIYDTYSRKSDMVI